MGSKPLLMLLFIYLLILNILSNGLAFSNYERDMDIPKIADSTWYRIRHIATSEDSANEQNESNGASSMWQQNNRRWYPPCTRWGCGKREIHDKITAPYRFLRSKLRHLRRTSTTPEMVNVNKDKLVETSKS